MSKKHTSLQKIEYLRSHVRILNYLVVSGGQFQDILDEFEIINYGIDDLEHLVGSGIDPFRKNELQEQNY